jgi:feruloyl esterase
MLTLMAAAALSANLTVTTCESLSGFVLERATITSAEAVREGVFVPPNGNASGEPIPAHCRLKLHLTPTTDSNINAELWLPLNEWNGRFLAIGNGG